MDLGEAVRVGGLGFREQGEALGVALQHGVEQGWRRRTAPPAPPSPSARAGGEADVAAVERKLAGDGAQQRGLAGAVAADQADAAARVDRQVGAVQQRAAAEADGDAGDDEEAHGGGVIGPVGGRSSPGRGELVSV